MTDSPKDSESPAVDVAVGEDDVDPADGDAGDVQAELARLRAERDALQAQVASLESAPPSRQRGRKVLAVVLVVASCLSFLTGGIGVWASRNFLDTDIWLSRTDPLIEDPAVRDAVSSELTTAAMQLVRPEELFREALPDRAQILAGPLSGAVEGFVRDQVDKVVASDAFERLWREVNRQAHTSAVKVIRGESDVVVAGDDTITINLLPLLNRVLAQITSVSPELFGRTVDIPDVQIDEIPASAVERINTAFGTDLSPDFAQIEIDDNGALKEVQDAVRLFDRIVWVSVAVFVAATIGALAASTDRRRTLLQLAVTDFVILILLRRVGARIETEVLDLVRVEENRPAAKAVVAALLSGLYDGTRALLWVLGAIIVVALLSGPYRWARELRTRVATLTVSLFSAARDRGTDPATAAWLVAHRDALQVAVAALAVVLLWWLNLGWIAIFVVLALAGIAVFLLARLPEPPVDDAAAP